MIFKYFVRHWIYYLNSRMNNDGEEKKKQHQGYDRQIGIMSRVFTLFKTLRVEDKKPPTNRRLNKIGFKPLFTNTETGKNTP